MRTPLRATPVLAARAKTSLVRTGHWFAVAAVLLAITASWARAAAPPYLAIDAGPVARDDRDEASCRTARQFIRAPERLPNAMFFDRELPSEPLLSWFARSLGALFKSPNRLRPPVIPASRSRGAHAGL